MSRHFFFALRELDPPTPLLAQSVKLSRQFCSARAAIWLDMAAERIEADEDDATVGEKLSQALCSDTLHPWSLCIEAFGATDVWPSEYCTAWASRSLTRETLAISHNTWLITGDCQVRSKVTGYCIPFVTLRMILHVILCARFSSSGTWYDVVCTFI